MKKKQYMTPATKACKLESMNMLAASNNKLGIGNGPADPELEALSNKDVWSDGLW